MSHFLNPCLHARILIGLLPILLTCLPDCLPPVSFWHSSLSICQSRLPAFLPFFLSFSLLSPYLSYCHVAPYACLSAYLFPALLISGIYPCLSTCIPAFLPACPFACPPACPCSLSTKRCPEAEFLDVIGTKALTVFPCYLQSPLLTYFTLPPPPDQK
jgi:hypothetical protein